MNGRWWIGLVLVVAGAAHAAEDSPVAQADKMIEDLAKQGKDVTAARAQLDALRPEWKAIEEKRDALQKDVEAFRPKMEAVFHGLQKQGGGDNPVVGAEKLLDQVAAHGKDVKELRTALDALRPDWDAIAKLQEQLGQSPPDKRGAAEQELRAKVDAFRPRMEAFGQRVHAVAESK